MFISLIIKIQRLVLDRIVTSTLCRYVFILFYLFIYFCQNVIIPQPPFKIVNCFPPKDLKKIRALKIRMRRFFFFFGGGGGVKSFKIVICI